MHMTCMIVRVTVVLNRTVVVVVVVVIVDIANFHSL